MSCEISGQRQGWEREGENLFQRFRGPKPCIFVAKNKAESDFAAGKLFLPPTMSRIKPRRNLLVGPVAKISLEKAWEAGERESICLAGRG